MLSIKNNTFDSNNYHKNTVIGEFSGRDSVAAILKAYEDGIDYILPVATFAGTEYGNFDSITDNYVKLKERVDNLYGDKKTLYPLIEHNDEKLWHLLNGRFSTLLHSKYNFYSPCIGCHLYFHLTKLKFAKDLSKVIISGERESHDGRIKVNQLHETLETYKSVIKNHGYELMMPLQTVTDGDEVENLIGWDWQEGQDHPKCVLSGNYRDVDGKAVYDLESLNRFLDFYIKMVGHYGGQYVLGQLDFETLTQIIKDKI